MEELTKYPSAGSFLGEEARTPPDGEGDGQLACIHCESTRVKYNGRVKSSRRRRFYCKSCKKSFSEFHPNSLSPYYGLRTDEETIKKVVGCLQSGLSIRKTADLMYLNHKTVAKIKQRTNTANGEKNHLSAKPSLTTCTILLGLQDGSRLPSRKKHPRAIPSKRIVNERLRILLMNMEREHQRLGRPGAKPKPDKRFKLRRASIWLPTPKEIREACVEIKANRPESLQPRRGLDHEFIPRHVLVGLFSA